LQAKQTSWNACGYIGLWFYNLFYFRYISALHLSLSISYAQYFLISHSLVRSGAVNWAQKDEFSSLQTHWPYHLSWLV